MTLEQNIHRPTVRSFGQEWARFTQEELGDEERKEVFEQYFGIFPWEKLSPDAVGFDAGCGSGRWAALVAPRVGRLHLVEPSSEALAVAKRNLSRHDNCEFHEASLDTMPFGDESMDFGYCLGVLHYVPDAQAGIAACARKLRRGAPLLLYVYYAFENRPLWFYALWRASDLVRRLVSRLPFFAKYWTTWLIALLAYWPVARTSLLLEKLGLPVDAFPLAPYRKRSFYTMHTDAFDRFASPIEHRYTARQLKEMMEKAGLRDIALNDAVPYWCAVGYKA